MGKFLNLKNNLNFDLKLLAYSLLLGACSGLAGGGFRLLLDRMQAFRDILYAWAGSGSFYGWLAAALFTMFGVTASFILVQKYAREAGGSGVQEIEGALDGLFPIRWRRILPVKFTGSLLSLGGGLTLGKEGPTIHICSCIGKAFQEKFRLSDNDGHILLAAGAAAGLASAFNAPFASLIFIMEEMRSRFRYNFQSFQCIVIAVAASDLVVRSLTGQGPVIKMRIFDYPDLSSLYLFPVLGIILGIIGFLFNRLVLSALDAFSRVPSKYALLPPAGISLLIAVTGILCYDMIGGGYLLFHHLFYNSPGFTMVLIHLIVRFFLIILCYGSGVPGGIFVPMLTIGALTGMLFGISVTDLMPAYGISPQIFAITGMAAIFAATIRAPVTGIVLVIEMTGNTNMMLPLMLATSAAAISTTILGNQPIYSSLLKRRLEKTGLTVKGGDAGL